MYRKLMCKIWCIFINKPFKIQAKLINNDLNNCKNSQQFDYIKIYIQRNRKHNKANKTKNKTNRIKNMLKICGKRIKNIRKNLINILLKDNYKKFIKNSKFS